MEPIKKSPPIPMPPLYRGLSAPLLEDGELAFLRTDRRPRNTLPAFNALFNLMIERKFGIPNIRRQSLFVTGEIRRAAAYAKEIDAQHLCKIHPNGNYRYLYSPCIHDSYALDREFTAEYFGCFFPWNRGPRFSEFLNPKITLNDLDDLLGRPEIDNPIEGWSPTTLQERLYSTMDRLLEKYDYRMDEGIAEAASLGVEIMLFDCPSGYRQYHADPEMLPDSDAAPLPENPLRPETPLPTGLYGNTVVFSLSSRRLPEGQFLPCLTDNLLRRGAHVEFVVVKSQESEVEACVALSGKSVSFSRIVEFDDLKLRMSKDYREKALHKAKIGCLLRREGITIITDEESVHTSVTEIKRPSPPVLMISDQAGISDHFGFAGGDWPGV